jgi:hypothetical protein
MRNGHRNLFMANSYSCRNGCLVKPVTMLPPEIRSDISGVFNGINCYARPGILKN